MASTTRRWDPAPLVALDGGTLRDTARRLRIDPAVLCRPLTDKQADRYATLLGVHPVQVWGTRWWE